MKGRRDFSGRSASAFLQTMRQFMDIKTPLIAIKCTCTSILLAKAAYFDCTRYAVQYFVCWPKLICPIGSISKRSVILTRKCNKFFPFGWCAFQEMLAFYPLSTCCRFWVFKFSLSKAFHAEIISLVLQSGFQQRL